MGTTCLTDTFVVRADTGQGAATSATVSVTITPLPPGRIYVVSTTGSDNNSGSLSAPYQSVARGMSVLQPGDTLYIRTGTYVVGNPRFSQSGLAGAPITIAGYPGDPRPALTRNATTPSVFIIDQSWWSNFTFKDLVKINTYVVGYKPDQLPILREVRAEMLKDVTPPASTLVGVQGLVNPDLLIEIETIAVID